MRTIDLHLVAPAIDSVLAYSRISDFARYPEFTDTVVSVEVGSVDVERVESTWTVKFRRGLLRWTEVDTFDPEQGVIDFEQTSGDFAEFNGSWRVRAHGSGTAVNFTARFDLGMPSLSEILDPVAESALRENITVILTGLLGEVTIVTPDHV
ncbi:type II toxin-antitoxin system RatA family toxin [Nocardia sp. NPDC058058]|uniref:type II toxin-antitoxin system RatA family toxin n=1 Tax=Nocardia sp. NPDC058058 TaxID=3346317 RepID=UPI0036DEA8DE